METFKLRTHVGSDGVLRLDVPAEMINRDVDVVVVMQAVGERAVDALGWPVGFFDRTYGALADDPLERPEELAWDKRDDAE